MSNILIRNQNMNAFLRNGVWSLFIIFILGLKMSTHKTKQNETKLNQPTNIALSRRPTTPCC